MSGFSEIEMALAQFVKMDINPLAEYQELCEHVIGLLDQQNPDSMGNIYIPKSTIGKVLQLSKVMALSLLAIKANMTVETPLSETDTVLACKRFIEGAKNKLQAGDVVYFLPRCCPFGDIPPGVPFIVSDPFPVENEEESWGFPVKYAVELVFLDKRGAISTTVVDKRRISTDKYAPSAMVNSPETATVS